MKASRLLMTFFLAAALTACGGGDMEDLQRFMDEAGKDMQGKIEPLPQIKPYEPFSYEAFDLPDPFKPRKLSAAGGGGGLQPDLTRPREPLEAYSLETLKMVGMISKKNGTHAVIATPDKTIYHVRAGNYMGQNFGLISRITDTEITLKEIVQDSAGDWAERTSTMTLQE
ncbi:pilus assembly protein PilP [Betaproteobacteria bacterium SCN2]|jgi:type IV pilus assembly protein PilP|nr:pilus assembly protein PilP [Betaproteobacteria bacterium SCN2]